MVDLHAFQLYRGVLRGQVVQHGVEVAVAAGAAESDGTLFKIVSLGIDAGQRRGQFHQHGVGVGGGQHGVGGVNVRRRGGVVGLGAGGVAGLRHGNVRDLRYIRGVQRSILCGYHNADGVVPHEGHAVRIALGRHQIFDLCFF